MITDVTMEMFDKFTHSFEKIDAKTAEAHLNSDSYTYIFVGRRTCPYCRLFISKLSPVATETETLIYFLDSEDEDDLDQIQIFRDKYEIKTVPTLIVKTPIQIDISSDSSMPEKLIREKLLLDR